jgi:hypothetical protein
MGKTHWIKGGKNMKEKRELLKRLKTYPIVQVACQQSKISRSTYYRWRSRDTKFRELADKSLKSGYGFINDLAESKLIGLIKDGNITGIIYWLNHRHPAYSERQMTLSKNDQQLILSAISSNDSKPAYQMLATNVVNGKITRPFFNAFSSIINRISKSNVNNNGDSKIEILQKLITGQQRKW